MTKIQIEAWALSVLERAVKDGTGEDSRVEFKQALPEPKKTARRLAGHANAARGDPILWLIGISDEAKVIGVDTAGFAVWFDQVTRCFDGPTPEMIDITMTIEGKGVLALFFNTERAPYVVKNTDGGGISADVPWREATRIRSATRNELLVLLSRQSRIPSVELLCAAVKLHGLGNPVQLVLHMDFYFSPSDNQTRVIPNHRVSVTITNKSDGSCITLNNCEFSNNFLTHPMGWLDPSHAEPQYQHRMVEATNGEVVIKGPGKTRLGGVADVPIEKLFLGDIEIRAELGIAGDNRSIVVGCLATFHTDTGKALTGWFYPSKQGTDAR